MNKVDILPQPVQTMETGKIKYKLEHSVIKTLSNHKDKTEFKIKDEKLPLSQKNRSKYKN